MPSCGLRNVRRQPDRAASGQDTPCLEHIYESRVVRRMLKTGLSTERRQEGESNVSLCCGGRQAANLGVETKGHTEVNGGHRWPSRHCVAVASARHQSDWAKTQEGACAGRLRFCKRDALVDPVPSVGACKVLP